MNYIFYHYKNGLKSRSQAMRKSPTRSEKIMWNEVLRKDKTGYRFLRQKPIDRFILDFYCPKLKLGIEIDGGIHEEQSEYDLERTLILEERYGIKIIRFSNKEVINNLKIVESRLRKFIFSLSNPNSL